MRRTWRVFLWETGPLVPWTLLLVVVGLLVRNAANGNSSAWNAVLLVVSLVGIGVAMEVAWIQLRYPRRTDLPEWQENERRRVGR